MRKKRDTSAKREAILDAAIDTFIEFGLEKASMDLVAEKANSSKRTVYNHFPSKESLIEEAFNLFLKDAFKAKKITYDPAKSIKEQLSDFADSKIRLTQDSRKLGLMKITLSLFLSDPSMAKRAIKFSDSQEDGFITWLEQANEEGRLNVDNAELAAESFWSLFSGTFFWPPVLRGPVPKKKTKELKEEFLEIFLARYSSS